MYKSYIKHIIDIFLSSMGSIVLAIPMAVIAVILKLGSLGHVFFWQKRVTVHSTTFMMPKFRTMYADTPANMPTHLLNDPKRWITKNGKWSHELLLVELHKHSVDCIIIHSHKYMQVRTALMEVTY